MPDEKNDLWVLDTSGILAIRHYIKEPYRKYHLDQLDELVADRSVVTHPKVLNELIDGSKQDIFSKWAKKTRDEKTACRFGDCRSHMRQAMSIKAVDRCIEHLATNKKTDPADPYVIAQGMKLREDGHFVWVVTNEREQFTGYRSSLNVAAGAARLSPTNYESMLDHFELWNEDHRVERFPR